MLLCQDHQQIRGTEEKASEQIEEDRRTGTRTSDNDAYCNDILIQSSAVSAAMNGFNRELLAAHIHSCVVRDIRDGKDEVVDELIATIQKLMK